MGRWWERNYLAILWLLLCFILGIVCGSWLVDTMLS